MKITIKICTVFIYFFATQFISGCASWEPVQNNLFSIQKMPLAEARVVLKESFISAINDAGDIIGVDIYKEKVTKYYATRAIGNNGVIFLYKNYRTIRAPGESRFAYALLSLPQGTHIDFFRNRTAKNFQYKWHVEFNGNDAGWATGYTDKEPFFAITTVSLNNRHKHTHRNDLWFKSEENMKRFLNALSSLYPHITY